MVIKIGGTTDRGLVREQNEDSFGIEPALGLAVVADGMGGHKAGEVASRMAVDIVIEKLRALSGPAAEDPKSLAAAVADSSFEIFNTGKKDPNKRGMGSTIVALWVRGPKAVIASVGDSRVYLRRGTEVRALTQDHTIVQELVNAGRLTPEEAELHPFRNVLSRALGVEGRVEVDLIELDLHAGDRLLLCSDGLYGYAPQNEVDALLLRDPEGSAAPEALAKSLIDLANHSGGGDNVTAIIVEVSAENDDASLIPPEEEPTESVLAATVRLNPSDLQAIEALASAHTLPPELVSTAPSFPAVSLPASTDPMLPALPPAPTDPMLRALPPVQTEPNLSSPHPSEIPTDPSVPAVAETVRMTSDEIAVLEGRAPASPEHAAPAQAAPENPFQVTEGGGVLVESPSGEPDGNPFGAAETIRMSTAELAILLGKPPQLAEPEEDNKPPKPSQSE